MHFHPIEPRPDFSRHRCMPPVCLSLHFSPLWFQLKAREKERILWLHVCKCLHLLCAVNVGGSWLEAVRPGTEAFCRCCCEKGVNGKCCGYQSDDVTWFKELCWTPPPPSWSRSSYAFKAQKQMKMWWRVGKTCLLVEAEVDVVV